MGKRDSAPTHSWVITSHFNRLTVRVSIVLLAVLAFYVVSVVMTLQKDCMKPAMNEFKLFSYNVTITTSKDFETCEEWSPPPLPSLGHNFDVTP